MFQNFESGADGSTGPARVALLRARLEAKGLTGFIVPRADAHQGEMVAPRDARLAWLTGFTGSAGVAVVLADRAALFVDGRYTIQAADQVAGDVFEIVPVHKTPVADWLGTALGRNAVLGYDAWLHGQDEIDRLESAAAKAGARLKALSRNPIDKIWEDQPPPPGGAVTIHPADLAGETAEAKRTRLGAGISTAGADAAVLSLPDSLAWLLNIRGSDLSHSPVAQGFGVLHGDGRVDLFMDPDRFGGAEQAHLGNAVTTHTPDALEAYLAGLGGKTLLLDRKTCPVHIARVLTEAGAKIQWGSDPCIAPKASKNEAELAGMRAAHLRDGAAMVRFLRWLDRQKPDSGVTEIDLVKKLESFREKAGCLDISFDTICGSGPHGAIVHYRVTRATDRALVPGEAVLIDSGGQYADGTTDITRTVPWQGVDPEVIRPFTLVLKGMIALSLARWPEGLAGRDLDPLARAALWQAGCDYDHGTGHGVGAYLNVHEGPASISRRGEVALAPGMVLSNEPGYYRAGAFGIRIENLVIVQPPDTPVGGDRPMLGFETLTLCPIDRRLIDRTLLTAAETAWLDAYHARVRTALTPQLGTKTAAWLAEMCAPI